MAEVQSFRELLAFVDAALAPDADVDVADAERRLQNAMPDLLNLLQQKVRRCRIPQKLRSPTSKRTHAYGPDGADQAFQLAIQLVVLTHLTWIGSLQTRGSSHDGTACGTHDHM